MTRPEKSSPIALDIPLHTSSLTFTHMPLRTHDRTPGHITPQPVILLTPWAWYVPRGYYTTTHSPGMCVYTCRMTRVEPYTSKDPLFLLYLSHSPNKLVLLNNKNPYCTVNTEKERSGAVLSGINFKRTWCMTKVQTLAIKPILPNKERQTKSNWTPAHTGSQLILQTCFMCFITLAEQERPVVTSPLQCPSYSPPAYSSSLILSIVSMLSLVGGNVTCPWNKQSCTVYF